MYAGRQSTGIPVPIKREVRSLKERKYSASQEKSENCIIQSENSLRLFYGSIENVTGYEHALS